MGGAISVFPLYLNSSTASNSFPFKPILHYENPSISKKRIFLQSGLTFKILLPYTHQSNLPFWPSLPLISITEHHMYTTPIATFCSIIVQQYTAITTPHSWVMLHLKNTLNQGHITQPWCEPTFTLTIHSHHQLLSQKHFYYKGSYSNITH